MIGQEESNPALWLATWVGKMELSYPLGTSLCSKHSRMKRMKFGVRERFSHSGRAKNRARAKRWKQRGGGAEKRECLPANPSILKNPLAHESGSWLVRHGYFDWQVYQVRLNDSWLTQYLWTCVCASLSKDLFHLAWMVWIRFYSEDVIF